MCLRERSDTTGNALSVSRLPFAEPTLRMSYVSAAPELQAPTRIDVGINYLVAHVPTHSMTAVLATLGSVAKVSSLPAVICPAAWCPCAACLGVCFLKKFGELDGAAGPLLTPLFSSLLMQAMRGQGHPGPQPAPAHPASPAPDPAGRATPNVELSLGITGLHIQVRWPLRCFVSP